jgi:hypothetical protein
VLELIGLQVAEEFLLRKVSRVERRLLLGKKPQQ